MKRIIAYRFIATMMSLVMFFTSFGFSLDIHYCQDEMLSMSIVGKAKSCSELKEHHCKKDIHHSCHNKDADSPGEDGNQRAFSEKNACNKDCCKNKTFTKTNLEEDAPNVSLGALDSVQLQVLYAFSQVFIFNCDFQAALIASYENYKPPNLEKDIQLLFQSFLI